MRYVNHQNCKTWHLKFSHQQRGRTLGFRCIFTEIKEEDEKSDSKLWVDETPTKSKGVTARSPGVRPGLSKGRYGHTTLRVPLLVPRDERITFFEIPSHPHPYTSTYSPAHREKMEMEGVSNKLLSEVALDQPARTTLYTTLCGN
ncbi:hypothetical protein YC2023_025320 [Brassica napus]